MKKNHCSHKQYFNIKMLVLLLGLLTAFKSQAQFEWRPISPLPTGNAINSVAYPSASKAVAVGNAGTVIMSEDNGLNWFVFNEPSEFSNLSVVAVDFADANNGYVLLRGGDGVMKTTSGGEAGWVSANGNSVGISGLISTTVGKEIQVLDANTVVAINSVSAYITTNGGTVWTDITVPGLGTSPRFEDIYFLDANTGYILTRGDGLYKTTDGGSNWTQLTGFTGIQASIVYFENETNGWIVEGTNSTVTNTIHRTTDGGTTWTSQDYPGANLSSTELIFTSSTEGKLFDQRNVYETSDAGVTWTAETLLPFSPTSVSYNATEDKFLLGGGNGALGILDNSDGSVLELSNSLTSGAIQDIHFKDLSNGFIATTNEVWRTADKGISWVSLDISNATDIEFGTSLVGYIVNSTKSVYKTTTGGLIWSEVSTLPAGSYVPQSMNFIDANTGWLVGSSSTVYKTTDGGVSWTSQTVPVSSLTLYDVFFLDGNTGYISSSGGHVFKTTDGGSNWTNTNFPESNNIFEMHWTDSNTGYLATRKIWKTTDGGSTWSSDGFSPTGTISEIQFLDANTGFATFQGGEVFKTTDAGSSWNTFVEGSELAPSLSYLEAIDVDNIWLASSQAIYNRSFQDSSSPTSIGLFLPESDFCPGEEFIATFTADRQIPDETITLQLSDEFGSFASPTNIGSLPEASTFSGNIVGTIPSMVTPSTNYRIRAVIPSLTGSDNGENLSVGGPPTPSSFLTSSSEVCNGAIGVAYEIEPVDGMSYWWSYSGTGSFNIINNGTPSITISFFNSATSGILSVVLSNDCGDSDPLELAISVGTPNAGGTASGGVTVCSGTSAPELSLSGHVGEVVRWEEATTPFSTYNAIANSDAATFTPPGTISETTRFRAIVQDGACSEAISSFTIVNVSQPTDGGSVIALSGNTVISNGTSPGNLSVFGHLGSVVRWEKSEAPYSVYTTISNTSTFYNPGALNKDTRFRAIIKNATCDEEESDFVEITMLDLTWNGSSWSNGSGPDGAGSDDIVIDGNYFYEAHGALHVNNLTINSGSRLEVDTEESLQVANDLINKGELEIGSGGVLIVNESGNITGNPVTIRRNTRYDDGRYSFVGSPVEQTSDVTDNELGSYIYYYDESIPYSTNDGLNRWISMSGQLIPGTGYTQAFQEEIVFEGIPNTGTITYSGSYTEDTNDDYEGWNLVANPYTTAINVDDFISNNNIEGAVYIWDDNGSDTGRGSNSDYVVANGTVATNTTPAGGQSRYNGKLGVAQGFFVKLLDDSDTDIVFTESMRSAADNEDEHFFRAENENSTSYIRINLTSNDGLFKQAILGYPNDISISEIDKRFDARVFNTDAEFSIYTQKLGKALAIQGTSIEVTEIPIGIHIAEADNYSIGVEFHNLSNAIYLIDKQKEEVHDLSLGSYQFYTEAGQIDDRFVLTVSSTITKSSIADKTYFQLSQKVLFVARNDSSNPYRINVLDLSGKEISSHYIAGSGPINLNHLPDGIYLISDGHTVNKLLLK